MTDDPLRPPAPDPADLPEAQPFAEPEPEPVDDAAPADMSPRASGPAMSAPAAADDAPTVAYSPPPERRPDWASPSWKHAATADSGAAPPALGTVPPASPVVRSSRTGT